MIDFNYINSLEELPANPVEGGSYKVTRDWGSDRFNPQGKTLTVFILHGGKLCMSASSSWGANTELWVMGEMMIGRKMTLGSGSSLNVGEMGLILSSGGKYEITTNVSVSNGDHPCTFTAPRKQVFSNITVTGIWDIPAAYPEWFTDLRPTASSELVYSGISDDKKTSNYELLPDWSEAINKAIKMKGSGEVSLDRGCYCVKNKIFMNAGINLRGASGLNIDNVLSDRGSTVILTCMMRKDDSNADTYYSDFVIYLNLNEDGVVPDKKMQYLQAATSIENIFFKDLNWTHPKCILAACPCHFNNLTFRNFRQCIKYASYYCDGRRITNCNIQDEFTVTRGDEDIYQIDLYSNGDACVVEGVHLNSKVYKALKVGNSCGTVINGNIFNAPVLIRNAKGVVFSANHLECASDFNVNQDTHLAIENSVVTLEGNFFEKSAMPSIVIANYDWTTVNGVLSHTDNGNSSVVTAIGNQFIYNTGKQKSYKEDTPIIDIVNDIKKRLKATNEFDIVTDGKGMISLLSNFRYAITSNNAMTAVFPFGIMIGTIKGLEPMDENNKPSSLSSFNGLSFQLSQQCLLTDSKVVTQAMSLSDSDNTLPGLGAVNSFYWLDNLGEYKYEYLIYPKGLVPTNENFVTIGSQDISEYGKGVIIAVNFNKSGGRGMVKLRRTRNNNSASRQTVILPICGARYLYDNGIAIAGFKWQPE